MAYSTISTEINPSITARLQTQHESIQVIISSINNKQLDWKGEPGKWNIHETIAHLVCYQQMFIEKIAWGPFDPCGVAGKINHHSTNILSLRDKPGERVAKAVFCDLCVNKLISPTKIIHRL